jgi:LPS export ABC transporter protein LptC
MFSIKNILLFSSFLVLLWACENDIKVINNISGKNDTVETGKDIETLYSDSGVVTVKVLAKRLYRFEGENPHIEMTKVRVNFYNSIGQVKSYLTANYAISYTNTKLMEAKNNVVVVNEKGEVLNTEHLVWDQNKAKIYSDKFVTINTGKELLYGTGLDANERFDHWVILHPKGSFTVKE